MPSPCWAAGVSAELIAILSVGVALAGQMLAMFGWLNTRINAVETRLGRVAALCLDWRSPQEIVVTLEVLAGQPTISFRPKGTHQKFSLPLAQGYSRVVRADTEDKLRNRPAKPRRWGRGR